MTKYTPAKSKKFQIPGSHSRHSLGSSCKKLVYKSAFQFYNKMYETVSLTEKRFIWLPGRSRMGDGKGVVSEPKL